MSNVILPGVKNEFTFSHTQDEIIFNYVGIHFSNPERNTYKYKLEPFEGDWQDAGTKRSARYSDLNPGSYIFKVMSANSYGVWSDRFTSFKINILPPWWNICWAYTIYTLLIVGLLSGTRRFELNRRKEKENKRILELEEARQLQLSTLPKELSQLPQLDIAVYMQTATEVGGDYYDFNVAMDGTFTVVIGDATGHGMKAATMVTAVNSLFNGFAFNHDIIFTFSEFSRCIRKMNFGRVSMCLTMVKIQNSTMQISSAGMPPAYIYRNKTKEVQEYQFEAMPLGALAIFPYQFKETGLDPGDAVLLLSDGFPELENKNDTMFGYSNIRSSFAGAAQKSADDIISHLKQEGISWLNNETQGDDITFVVIKMK